MGINIPVSDATNRQLSREILEIVKRMERKMATLAEAIDRLKSYLAGQGSLKAALDAAEATIQQMTDADAAEDANYEATISSLTQQLADQVSSAQAAADDITEALDAVADPATGGADPGTVEVGDLPPEPEQPVGGDTGPENPTA